MAVMRFAAAVTYFRTRTPKGDGNNFIIGITYIPRPFQNTNPERGRKQPLTHIIIFDDAHFRT